MNGRWFLNKIFPGNVKLVKKPIHEIKFTKIGKVKDIIFDLGLWCHEV